MSAVANGLNPRWPANGYDKTGDSADAPGVIGPGMAHLGTTLRAVLLTLYDRLGLP